LGVGKNAIYSGNTLMKKRPLDSPTLKKFSSKIVETESLSLWRQAVIKSSLAVVMDVLM